MKRRALAAALAVALTLAFPLPAEAKISFAPGDLDCHDDTNSVSATGALYDNPKQDQIWLYRPYAFWWDGKRRDWVRAYDGQVIYESNGRTEKFSSWRRTYWYDRRYNRSSILTSDSFRVLPGQWKIVQQIENRDTGETRVFDAVDDDDPNNPTVCNIY